MKKIIATMLSIVMCLALAVPAMAARTDVSSYVENEVEDDLDMTITGTAPRQNATRDDAINLLYSVLFETDIDWESTYRREADLYDFDDYRKASKEFFDEQQWEVAASQGVITGIGLYDEAGNEIGAELAPNDYVTRAQAAKILVEFIAQNEIDVELGRGINFRDVPEDAWYSEYVYQCSRTGLVEGTGNNYFEPEDYIKREDFFLIVKRLFIDNYDEDVEIFAEGINNSKLFFLDGDFEDDFDSSSTSSSSSLSAKRYYVELLELGEIDVIELDGKGDTYELDFDDVDTNISKLTKISQMTFTSSNTSIATVSSKGVITAKANDGVCIITAEYKGIYDALIVCIGDIDEKDWLILDPAGIYLYEKGDTAEIEYDTNIDSLNKASQITWKSLNSNVATVNSKGIVTAKADEGWTIITAQYKKAWAAVRVTIGEENDNGDDDYDDPVKPVKPSNSTVEKLKKTTVIELAEGNLGLEQNFTVRGANSNCTVKVVSPSGMYKLSSSSEWVGDIYMGTVEGLRDGAYESVIIQVLYGKDVVAEKQFTFDYTD